MSGTIQKLTAKQLDFVTNYVSMNFLKQFGSSEGFKLFCDAVEDAGLMTCGSGTKEAYATYLLNSSAPGSKSLFDKVVEAYKGLDKWTQASMKNNIKRGQALSGSYNTACFAGKLSIADLRELADSYDIDLSKAGNNKLKMCAILQDKLPTDVTSVLFAGGKIAPLPLTVGYDAQLMKGYNKQLFDEETLKAKMKKKTKPTWQDINSGEWAFTGF
jgi:hypothetical protein